MNALPLENRSDTTIAKILVIDDDPIQVQLLTNILKNEKYDIIGYQDNLKGLEDAARILPDLILLDLVMPRMNGFEICRKLKSDAQTRDIPVIFVTATTDQTTESEGFKLGAVDYITKPFNPVVIQARVRTHVELKRHRDSLEQLVRERTAERDKSRQQFQDLVEKSLVGIAIVQNERLAYQNPELTRIVPDLGEKILTKDFEFIHPEHLPQLLNIYHSIVDGQVNNVESDLRIASKDGGARGTDFKWFNCRASNFTYQGQEAILINLVDITHTKELEKLLLNRNKMASLGRIASGMAHEIRNPLTGITSYLYTLEQLCDSKTLLPKDIALMKEIVEQLKLASHKVDSVIKRVLDFSRPAAPRMALVDINQCLYNVINLTAVTMRKAGIRVSTSLSDNLPWCHGDMALMEQVFLNLTQNAARALKNVIGTKKIAISSYTVGNQIHIAVSDSGPGVPDELKDKIFDPFFTTNPDGSGIGLSIAQRIVTDHNGSLTVTTGKLGGAHFTVSLPIEKRKFPR
jgi:signal transduction histidine kinase/DNA-binding response OmpR family regulator